jgi:hypothetical protein
MLKIERNIEIQDFNNLIVINRNNSNYIEIFIGFNYRAVKALVAFKNFTQYILFMGKG